MMEYQVQFERGMSANEFDFFGDGLVYKLLRKMGFPSHAARSQMARAVLFSFMAWLPLFILTRIDRSTDQASFIRDIKVHARLLLAVPLLILAESAIPPKIRQVLKCFLSGNLLTETDKREVSEKIRVAQRVQRSVVPETMILFLIAIVMFFSYEPNQELKPWQLMRLDLSGSSMMAFTPAAWWYICVSLPIFQFLSIRWLWRFFVWVYVLAQFAKLDLRIIPTNPDGNGGLGFVRLGQSSFSVLGFVFSAVLSAYLFEQIYFESHSFSSIYRPVIFAAVSSYIVIMGPLLIFTPQLMKKKREGLFSYSLLSTDRKSVV